MFSRDRTTAGIAFALFLLVAGYLFWMESSQIHLRFGIKLSEERHPAAIPVLRGGIAKDSSNYMLHHYLAKALYGEAFSNEAQGSKSSIMLIEAKRELHKSHTLRFDSFNYLLRASVHEAEGNLDRQLADLNLSFFFSQNRRELNKLVSLKSRQAKLSKKLFKSGSSAVSLIVVFNHLSQYKPFWSPNAAGNLLKQFFLAIPPSLWLQENSREESDRRKEMLKDIFENLDESEQGKVVEQLSTSGFSFLVEFLGR